MKKSPGTKAQRAAVVIVSIRHLTKSIGQWQRHIHGGSTRTCELPCSSKELVEGAGGFLVLYTILLPCATFYFTFHISTYSSRILDSRRLDLLCGGVGVKKSSSLSLTQNPNVKKAEFCSILVLVHCINGLHHTTTKWGGEEKIFLVRMKEPELFSARSFQAHLPEPNSQINNPFDGMKREENKSEMRTQAQILLLQNGIA